MQNLWFLIGIAERWEILKRAVTTDDVIKVVNHMKILLRHVTFVVLLPFSLVFYVHCPSK